MKPGGSGKIQAGKINAADIKAGRIDTANLLGDRPISVGYQEGIYFLPISKDTSKLSPLTYDKKFYNDDTKQAVMVPVNAMTNTVTIELEALELLLKVAGYDPSDS